MKCNFVDVRGQKGMHVNDYDVAVYIQQRKEKGDNMLLTTIFWVSIASALIAAFVIIRQFHLKGILDSL